MTRPHIERNYTDPAVREAILSLSETFKRMERVEKLALRKVPVIGCIPIGGNDNG